MSGEPLINRVPFGYYHGPHGGSAWVRGPGDATQAMRQSESDGYLDYLGLDADEMEPIRGWTFANLKGRAAITVDNFVAKGRQPKLPAFVMVRDGHATAHIEHSLSGSLLTGSDPIDVCRERLATMRYWMEKLTDGRPHGWDKAQA